jgi:UDP-glucose 4-epimerase
VCRGLPLTLHGDGSQTRDFIYVGDVVRALGLAMDHCHGLDVPAADVANVCTGRQTSIAAIAERLMVAAGKRVPLKHMATRPGDIPTSVGDPKHAEALFGFRSTTSLADGLGTLLALAQLALAMPKRFC